MDVARYLERIGYTGDLTPNAANLAALVRAHRLRVPYETLDLWRGVHTSLDLDALYDKIVVRRWGGYCFELSGLFAALLRELGYEVREYAGRWLRNNQQNGVPRRCHRVVCVRTGTGPAKIVDVGLGLPYLFAPLDIVLNLPQTQAGRVYRVVKDETLGYVVETMNPDSSWLRLFSFDGAPQLPIDFEYPHWWCETHPESVFRRGFRVFRLTEEGGWMEIHGSPLQADGSFTATFTVCSAAGEVRQTPLVGADALGDLLATEFGVEGWELGA
ncbi:MAG: arylamine N-acetyltransferase [bacterium]|nr:arylamine N-acetyltransferase [bacterium]